MSVGGLMKNKKTLIITSGIVALIVGLFVYILIAIYISPQPYCRDI